MLMSIIEKRNQPVRTEISFTKKEWKNVPEIIKNNLQKLENKETARQMKFYIEGDLLNKSGQMRLNKLLEGRDED